MYSYRFSPNMQIYLLRFCAAESMIPIFRPFSSTRQLSKSCTSLASFLLSIKSMQIWSVNLVRPWCNLLPLISSIFRFFKFAEWAEVCRTRKSSRKRITRTSLGLRCFDTVFQRPYRYFSIALKVVFSLSNRYKISHYHYHYYNYNHHHHQSPDNGSELLGSEEESEESDTVLDKEGNSENDLVIADLEEQSIMTGHAGASTFSTDNACTLYYQTITCSQNQ